MSVRARLLVCAMVLALAAVGLAGASSLHCRNPRAAAATGVCGPLIPANKCNPILSTTTTRPLPPQTEIPPLPPVPASPTTPSTTQCGRDFFTSVELDTLRARFGLLDCFQFAGSDQWIVFGDGMTVSSTSNPPGAAPGGAMVAVLECSDSECLTANSTHSFTSFTVYYPPDPSSGRSDLGGFYGEGLLMVYNGNCSMFLFDVNTLTWYPASASDAQSLASGVLPPAVNVPSEVSGATALSQLAPRSTGDCPSYDT